MLYNKYAPWQNIGMDFNWDLLFIAMGLAFIFEGMPYFLFPDKIRTVLRILAERPPSSLRMMGLTSMAVGLVLVYAVMKL